MSIICCRELLSKELWTEFSYWLVMAPMGGTDTRNLVTWDTQSKVVRFAHLSVQEYLETEFSRAEVDSMAAECCLSLQHPVDYDREGRFVPASARYAGLFWIDHTSRSCGPGQHIRPAVMKLLTRFLGTLTTPNPEYHNWYIWILVNGDTTIQNLLAQLMPHDLLFLRSHCHFGADLWQF